MRLALSNVMRQIVWLSLGLCAYASSATAEVRLVRAGDNLQTALNAARAGDELRLAPDAIYFGNFILPVVAGLEPIVLRTDLPDSSLPGDNQRVTPASAARFARIVSPNTAAALRTAPGAHNWTVRFLEFPSNKEGYGDIVQLGDGSSAQAQISEVPYEIVFDHVYIHGHPLYGQKRGIALNARAVTIRNSHISDIKAVGVDAQAIGGWNGPGPFLIENNYLEASGEVFLLGGSDPAIPNLVSEDVIVRFNHVTRPMAWRDPVVATPLGVAAAPATGGSLPPGNYAYRIVARRQSGGGSVAMSDASVEIECGTAGGSIRLDWSAVPDAADYMVFGRAPGEPVQFWVVTEPSFTDTGATGYEGTPPSEATRWQVKNLFELKNARRAQIEDNLFENNWVAAQPGYAIVLTPRNQDGGCPQCVLEAVDFNHNIVRNTAAGINILGYDTEHSSQQTNGVRIAYNLIQATTGLGGNGWGILMGEAPRDVVIDHNTFDLDGTTILYAYGGTEAAPRKMTGFRFTNNAARHGEYGINGASASTGNLTLQMYFTDPVVTGNWLSGGSSSRYPAGNRFETPFALMDAAGGPGAEISTLQPRGDAIVKGLMVPLPERPKNLRTILSR